MTTDEGVLDADAKLTAALAKLQHVCDGLASDDAKALATQVMQSPRMSGLIEGFKIAMAGETIDADGALEMMTEALEIGMSIGIKAAARGVIEVIKKLAE